MLKSCETNVIEPCRTAPKAASLPNENDKIAAALGLIQKELGTGAIIRNVHGMGYSGNAGQRERDGNGPWVAGLLANKKPNLAALEGAYKLH